ncbi:MAG: hypothetical protein ACJA1L_001809 [Paracoccaceae bacterium]|jgi:hypothetical protein
MDAITKVDTDAFRAAFRPACGICTKALVKEVLDRIIAGQAKRSPRF